jgi:hypothetical protein
MALLIMGIALMVALAVIVFLAILLRDATAEINIYHTPVDVPDITWRWREEAVDDEEIPRSKV